MAGGHIVCGYEASDFDLQHGTARRDCRATRSAQSLEPRCSSLHFLNGPRGLATVGRANNIRHLGASITNGRGGLHCACKVTDFANHSQFQICLLPP
jgi:hypothetical protein